VNLTVALPLFHAERWFVPLVENFRRIPAWAKIVVSDETDSDDTAHRIARAFPEDRRIRVRKGQGREGWREHCNALIRECDTEFFALLPQDDQIAPGYYENLVAALEENPEAGIAFGTIHAIFSDQPGVFRPLEMPPIELGRCEPWQEAVALECSWNLGVPFRGVIRRRCLREIPVTPGDRFADQIWVFRMALEARLLPVPAVNYFKSYHDGNTHSTWQPLSPETRLNLLGAELTAALPPETASLAMDLLAEEFRRREAAARSMELLFAEGDSSAWKAAVIRYAKLTPPGTGRSLAVYSANHSGPELMAEIANLLDHAGIDPDQVADILVLDAALSSRQELDLLRQVQAVHDPVPGHRSTLVEASGHRPSRPSTDVA
jgi:hypothetical protein